jgi:hypothetical protein
VSAISIDCSAALVRHLSGQRCISARRAGSERIFHFIVTTEIRMTALSRNCADSTEGGRVVVIPCASDKLGESSPTTWATAGRRGVLAACQADGLSEVAFSEVAATITAFGGHAKVGTVDGTDRTGRAALIDGVVTGPRFRCLPNHRPANRTTIVQAMTTERQQERIKATTHHSPRRLPGGLTGGRRRGVPTRRSWQETCAA